MNRRGKSSRKHEDDATRSSLPGQPRSTHHYEKPLPLQKSQRKSNEKNKPLPRGDSISSKCHNTHGEGLRESSSDPDEGYEVLDPPDTVELPPKSASRPAINRPLTTIRSKAQYLHRLLREENLPLVRPYLEGLPPDVQQRVVNETIDGQTALYLALRRKALLLMYYMLETCGADPDQPFATTTNRGEPVESSCLIQAAADGNLDAVKLLVTNGADVNWADSSGWSALMRASYEGRADVVRYLVAHGADPNESTCHRGTCLLLAVDCPDVLRLLLEFGADVRATDSLGRTALHYAAEWGRFESADELLRHGADVNARDSVGNAPLHDAVATGSLQMVTNLVEAGADLYLRNDDKEDAILLAQLEEQTDKLRYLISVHKRRKEDAKRQTSL